MVAVTSARESIGRRQRSKEAAKRAVREVVPPRGLFMMRRAYAWAMTREARRAFSEAERGGSWLEEPELDRLQRRYPPAPGCGPVFPPPPGYGYDAATLAKRGSARASMLEEVSGPVAGRSVLELGCGDGMVSAALGRLGARTSALDVSSRLFDERARSAGVRLLEADATAVPINDDEFDLVFSFNSFEHFPSPDSVLAEAIRVARCGGIIYLCFGPLYRSPYGPHGAQSIKVPYSHFLFPRDVLDRYVDVHSLRPIPHAGVNGWALRDYRRLWERSSSRLDRPLYREIPEIHGVELIAQHPECFRGKVDEFDDLIIGTIEVAFRKVR